MEIEIGANLAELLMKVVGVIAIVAVVYFMSKKL